MFRPWPDGSILGRRAVHSYAYGLGLCILRVAQWQ